MPAEAGAYFAGLAPDFERLLQRGPDLGARLDNALTGYLQRGYQRVVIMNSDGPSLPPVFLVTAFETLANGADVVLGPCDDGGYYLIGLKRPAPRLLREVQMSTANVTADTLRLAAEEGLRVKLLPTWYDVDDAASPARLMEELAKTPDGVARHTRAFLAQRQALFTSYHCLSPSAPPLASICRSEYNTLHQNTTRFIHCARQLSNYNLPYEHQSP